MACFFVIFLIYTRGFYTTFIFHSLHCIILSRGGEAKKQISSAFRSYFPMFSPMLLLLVKKNGNHVLFGFVLSSEQSEDNNNSFILLIQFSWLLSQLRKLGMSRRQFHAGEEGQKATSEIHEELLGADKSYWTVFPVKISPKNFSANRSVVD